MKLRSITVRGFASFEREVRVDLPESGVVLVTGPNGHGKSSLFVESVVYAVWGKTLRGEDPRRVGKVLVDVETDRARFLVEGQDLKHTPKVGLAAWVDGGRVNAPTRTKTRDQARDKAGIPAVGVWVRSCVLSGVGANFAGGTDAERKRILESMLGLDQYDAASALCRSEIRAERRALEEARGEVKLAEQRADQCERRAAELVALVGSPTGVVAGQAQRDLDALSERVEAAQVAVERARKADSTARQRKADAAATVRAAERDLARVDHDACPTCGQGIPDALKAPLREAAQAARSELDPARAARAARDAAQALRAAEQALGALERREAQARAAAAQEAEGERRRAQAEDAIERARSEAKAARMDAERARERVAEHEQRVMVLVSADDVLGVRGVRSAILSRSLASLERLTNEWLDRIGDGYSVRVSPTRVQASGKTVDEISVLVSNPMRGELHPIRADSTGQNKRFNIAFTFALADLAASSSRGKQSTMLVDEAFDGLDTEGRELVAKALNEAARDRCVVVVSHDEELAGHLTPALHYRVEGGGVRRL